MNKIEKIKDWLKPYLKKDKVRDEHEEGFFHCAMLLNDFIDSLPEEPSYPKESDYLDKLMKEVQKYYSDNFDYITSDQPTLSILTNIARHFTEWQKRKMMEKAVEGYVTLTLTGVLTVAATIKEGDNIGIGDKVRIIIVKEE